MSDIDLTPLMMKGAAGYPRKRGRYSASDLWWITSGKMSPEKWLHQEEKTVDDVFRMWDGSLIHHGVQEVLQRGYKEEKREYPAERGVVIVGKADYLPTAKDGVVDLNEVWEIKSSAKLMTTAKPWHIHQTKLYCSMFGKDIGRIFQPVRGSASLTLRELGIVKRDDAWFLQQVEKLYEFHELVEQLWESEITTKSGIGGLASVGASSGQ